MKKRLIPIIALSLIAMIAITTVIFAVCSSNFRPDIKDPSSISLAGSEVNGGNSIYLNEDQSKKVYELFNNSFGESALNALFNSRLGYGAELFKKEDAIKNFNELTKYVMFDYENENELPKVTHEGVEVEYKYAIIKIEEVETANIQKVQVYLVQLGSSSSSYYFETFGNYYELFKYVNEII